ncbi:MAG TPA: hypothetical protein VGZ93_03870 [Candidatus Methylacidiphilales bacterium]|jgi:hypothetical protein|nr:hypothetical protein [Candidatus Methylacidiphilales bacterium]
MPAGFIPLSPRLDYTITCPNDNVSFPAEDWAIAGTMTMATGTCPQCKTTWWTDLPYGLGFMAPTYINVQTGQVIRPHASEWYAKRIGQGWLHRGDYKCELKVETRRKPRNPCLVNCLYPIYGEAVDGILRSNQLRDSGMDLILLIPSNLRWLVPDSIAEVWEVQIDANYKYDELAVWNNELDRKVKTLVGQLPECWVPQIHQPQYLLEDELKAALQIAPFPREKWYEELRAAPRVTFMWRTQRLYPTGAEVPPLITKLAQRKIPILSALAGALERRLNKKNLERQRDAVVAVAEGLRRYLPDLDFAVTGFGRDVSFPAPISDLREERFSIAANQNIIRRTARSHVLIGVHGSSIVPASGFSGAVVELMPDEKLPAILTTLLVNITDAFEALYLYRCIPVTTSSATVVQIVLGILANYPVVHYCYNRRYYRPTSSGEIDAIRSVLRERSEALAKYPLLKDSPILVG